MEAHRAEGAEGAARVGLANGAFWTSLPGLLGCVTLRLRLIYERSIFPGLNKSLEHWVESSVERQTDL